MSDICFFCICLMRDVLLLLSTIFYDLWIKHVYKENVKKAAIYARANGKKPQSLTWDISAISVWIFMQLIWTEALLKYLSNDIYNSFVGYISSKILSRKKSILSCISPYTGHIWHIVENNSLVILDNCVYRRLLNIHKLFPCHASQSGAVWYIHCVVLCRKFVLSNTEKNQFEYKLQEAEDKSGRYFNNRTSDYLLPPVHWKVVPNPNSQVSNMTLMSLRCWS